jgi:perosamine synthetase
MLPMKTFNVSGRQEKEHMGNTIDLFRIRTDENDIRAVARVLERGGWWAEGPEIEDFEEAVASFSGRDYAVAFNSGTSAQTADLLARDIKGGEVIVPSFSFISTATSVVIAGANPVFAEIEATSLGLDPDDVERRINEKTRAIVLVHVGGRPAAGTGRLRDMAYDRDIPLIEDSAESMGASISGKLTGTFGSSGMYSYCQNKMITTGEGGMIVTDEKDLADRMRLLRSHGRAMADHFYSGVKGEYVVFGHNMRMSSITAALGLSQMGKLEENISLRKKAARIYDEKLDRVPGLETFKDTTDSRSVCQLYTIKLASRGKREKVMEALGRDGIACKVYFNPIHLESAYRKRYGYAEGDLPITEDISRKVLTLPMYPGLAKDDIDRICGSIEGALR